MDRQQFLDRGIPDNYPDKESLERGANAIADRAPAEYRQTTYLYFMVRYLTVVYEASFAAIPVQVWNEHRNAFDHYIRHITGVAGQSNEHVRRMEGHVQRAVLDICKILCHETQGLIEGRLSLLDKKSLLLIDNGTFFYQLQEVFDQAKDLFIAAKTSDLALGEDARWNTVVLSKYLDAVFASLDIQATLRKRGSDIEEARVRYDALHRESSADHIKLSLVSKAIWGVSLLIIGGVLTLVSTYVWPDMPAAIKDLLPKK